MSTVKLASLSITLTAAYIALYAFTYGTKPEFRLSASDTDGKGPVPMSPKGSNYRSYVVTQRLQGHGGLGNLRVRLLDALQHLRLGSREDAQATMPETSKCRNLSRGSRYLIYYAGTRASRPNQIYHCPLGPSSFTVKYSDLLG